MEIALKLNPGEADIAAVRTGLMAVNDRAAGRPSGYLPFAFHLSDPATGEIVGGATGERIFDWVFVDLLYVSPRLQGHGHGSALMARVEGFAREHGAIGIWLDTFSFQAKPFYERLGFSVFGTIDNHPAGGQRYFLQKRLDAAASH